MSDSSDFSFEQKTNLYCLHLTCPEGHDTTASAISWTLYSLAQHPDIQERARLEVQGVLKEKSSSNFDFEW